MHSQRRTMKWAAVKLRWRNFSVHVILLTQQPVWHQSEDIILNRKFKITCQVGASPAEENELAGLQLVWEWLFLFYILWKHVLFLLQLDIFRNLNVRISVTITFIIMDYIRKLCVFFKINIIFIHNGIWERSISFGKSSNNTIQVNTQKSGYWLFGTFRFSAWVSNPFFFFFSKLKIWRSVLNCLWTI